jgi:hypothetical protein
MYLNNRSSLFLFLPGPTVLLYKYIPLLLYRFSVHAIQYTFSKNTKHCSTACFCCNLKERTIEKGGGYGRWQMIGICLGLRRWMSVCPLILSPSISFSVVCCRMEAKKEKEEKNIDHHGQRTIPNISHLPDVDSPLHV